MAGHARRENANIARGAIPPVVPDVRYLVLALAALGSAVVGLVLFLTLTGRAEEMVPFGLLAVGVVLLVSAAFVLRREIAANAGPGPRLAPVVAAPTPEARATGGAVAAVAAPGVPRSRMEGSFGKGSDWRVVDVPIDPGEEAWLSWLPRGLRRLGPETGGSVAGVVTSPGRAGTLVAFPVRNYYGTPVLPPARSNPPIQSPPAAERESGETSPTRYDLGARGSSPAVRDRNYLLDRSSPFSDEELDRMFPPTEVTSSPFLRDAPDRVGVRPRPSPSYSAEPEPDRPEIDDFESFEQAVVAEAMSSPPPFRLTPRDGTTFRPAGPPAPSEGLRGDRAGTRPAADLDSQELILEAANPVPPHLRASGPLLRFEAPHHSGGAKRTPSPRSVCASCSKVVVNLRLSGPCPKCMRPLCNDCLREAMTTRGRGWCVDCSVDRASAS